MHKSFQSNENGLVHVECYTCGKFDKVHFLDSCDFWECEECLNDLE